MREDNPSKELKIANKIVDGSIPELKFHHFNWCTKMSRFKSAYVSDNMAFRPHCRHTDWLHWALLAYWRDDKTQRQN